MKKLVYITLGIVLFSALMFTQAYSQTTSKKLRHVVMFKFKDSATPDDVKKIVDAFKQLPKQITLIKDFEWGTNNSPENLNQGLTHCFFVTFESEKDRDAYLIHPSHKAFVDVLKPFFDKATVLDYWVEK